MPIIPDAGVQHFRRAWWPLLVALTAAYILAGKLGLHFAVVHPSATPIWPPTGVALAAVLLLGPRVWPAIFIGAFLVNVTTAGSVATSLGIALGNTLEAVASGFLINRFANGWRVFDRAQDIFKFGGITAFVGTPISATIGVTSLALGGYAAWSAYGAIWLTWWLGDAAGALIVAPVIVLWSVDRGRTWSPTQIFEVSLLSLAVIIAGTAVFMWPALRGYPVAFLSAPPLIWAAFRFGQREVATAVAVLAWLAARATAGGSGPFALSDPNASLLMLQVFLATIVLMTLPVAALIVERRGAAEEQERGDQRFRLAVEAAPNAMIMADERGRIVLANAQAEQVFGYARQELLGLPIEVLLPPRFREPHQQHRRDFLTSPETRRMGAGRDLFALRKDGSEVPVEIGLNPIRTEAGLVVLAAIIDITARRRLELERADVLADAKAARMEAEAANRTKDEFLAVLSHELRTPLTAMLGWARMLRTRQLDEAGAARALESIERNVLLQAQLVEDLLDVSRIVTGKLELDRRHVELPPVIEAAMDAVRPSAAEKGVALEATLDRDVSPVHGDAARLQQVVWNLVANAVKFTPPGGRVHVTLEPSADAAQIIVRDTGQGIAPDVLPHVFDRFRQADSSSRRAHGGLGLGLAIARQLVELHAGTVAAESQGAGRGATFTVRLPTVRREPRTLPHVMAVTRTGQGSAERLPSLRGARVLIVDDDAEARELLSAIMRACRAEVTAVASVGRALESLRARRPDVILADLGMPDEDGYDLIRRVRELGPGVGRIPVLAITAYAGHADRNKAHAAGYDEHLAKPVEPATLARIVAKLLGRAEAA